MQGNVFRAPYPVPSLGVSEEEAILARSMALGEKLGQRFTQWQEQFASVENVRHLGSMAAFDLVTAFR
ncbi:hypothetical protein [Marinobacter gelidimuriae]|uniref:hypothetical protein n=1 Tax=Marinobacter gelidimuriae TaxID=2739064 RepID=UPI0003A8B1AC|nr:hypothetical protein [Marinobacter gelidimuriae]